MQRQSVSKPPIPIQTPLWNRCLVYSRVLGRTEEYTSRASVLSTTLWRVTTWTSVWKLCCWSDQSTTSLQLHKMQARRQKKKQLGLLPTVGVRSDLRWLASKIRILPLTSVRMSQTSSSVSLNKKTCLWNLRRTTTTVALMRIIRSAPRRRRATSPNLRTTKIAVATRTRTSSYWARSTCHSSLITWISALKNVYKVLKLVKRDNFIRLSSWKTSLKILRQRSASARIQTKTSFWWITTNQTCSGRSKKFRPWPITQVWSSPKCTSGSGTWPIRIRDLLIQFQSLLMELMSRSLQRVQNNNKCRLLNLRVDLVTMKSNNNQDKKVYIECVRSRDMRSRDLRSDLRLPKRLQWKGIWDCRGRVWPLLARL